MRADAENEDFAPGLHVLRDRSPLALAGSLAARLRAELCATLPQAEAALAGRRALPQLGPGDLADLRTLAARVARAERISERTRERASADVARRLTGAGAGVAVHPETIRERAHAVVVARDALASAERALQEHDRAAAEPAAAGPTPAGQPPGAPVTPDPAPSGASVSAHTKRNRALGVVMAALGLGLVLLGLEVVPLWLALVPTLAASLWALRYLRPTRADDEEGRAEASSLLAEMAAATDAAFGAQRGGADEQRAVLVLRRDSSQEQVRLAERAWRDLTGDDVDVDEVEEVVRRFDPQHEHALVLASKTTSVRAISSVLDESRARWDDAWRALGRPAPAAAEAGAAIDELAARLERPVVLVGPATAKAEELASAAPAAPVIALEEPSGEGEREG